MALKIVALNIEAINTSHNFLEFLGFTVKAKLKEHSAHQLLQ